MASEGEEGVELVSSVSVVVVGVVVGMAGWTGDGGRTRDTGVATGRVEGAGGTEVLEQGVSGTLAEP